MTVKEIVKEYLIKHGYDGLGNDFCACTIPTLMEDCIDCIYQGNCHAGHILDCTKCEEWVNGKCAVGNNFCIGNKKDE